VGALGEAARRLTITGVILCLLAASSSRPQTNAPDPAQLVRQKAYLEAEAALSPNTGLSPLDSAFLQGVMANRRNRVPDSIRLLTPLLPVLAATSSEKAIIALSTLADDYEKSFRYGDAADAYSQLDREFGAYMSEPERRRAHNEAARWNLLREAPPQTLTLAAPFTLRTTRDPLGLPEAAVRLKGLTMPMILDTGANLCVMSRSTARGLGLALSSAQATTRGAVGDATTVHTTIVPDLQLGDALLRNVAFMVLDDKDLNFPQLHYRLPGSIGFPVLSALGKITFFADGRLGVDSGTATTTRGPGNLFLDRLTPVVAVALKGSSRLFTIDTGATGSYLSALYYAAHLAEFEDQVPGGMELTGAGGSKLVSVYHVRSAALLLGGACIGLEDVPVLTEPRGPLDDGFYGNIGQDALRQSRSYTFDFRTMNFTIEVKGC